MLNSIRLFCPRSLNNETESLPPQTPRFKEIIGEIILLAGTIFISSQLVIRGGLPMYCTAAACVGLLLLLHCLKNRDPVEAEETSLSTVPPLQKISSSSFRDSTLLWVTVTDSRHLAEILYHARNKTFTACPGIDGDFVGFMSNVPESLIHQYHYFPLGQLSPVQRDAGTIAGYCQSLETVDLLMEAYQLPPASFVSIAEVETYLLKLRNAVGRLLCMGITNEFQSNLFLHVRNTVGPLMQKSVFAPLTGIDANKQKMQIEQFAHSWSGILNLFKNIHPLAFNDIEQRLIKEPFALSFGSNTVSLPLEERPRQNLRLGADLQVVYVPRYALDLVREALSSYEVVVMDESALYSSI